MTHNLFLLCLFPFLPLSLSNIYQSPALVKAGRGEPVTLECNTLDLLIGCDSVFWFKVHERTSIKATFIHKSTKQKVCLGNIYNTTAADSGIYYCSARQSLITYFGNGSTVIVTEPNPEPTIMLYVSNASLGPDVSLQCVVLRVVPSETSISWIVGGTEMSGWTETGWTRDDESAPVEFVRAHLSVPSGSHQTGGLYAECVVEVGGKKFYKSTKPDYSKQCSWLLYFASIVGITVVTMIIIATMSLWLGRNLRKGTAQKSTEMEVQYASLDLVSTGCGGTILNRTC